jgi:ATP phosphoribosyltransferase
MQDGVFRLLHDAGIGVTLTARDYRPGIALAQFETKLLKPQNIVEMLHRGSRDLGFAGADWVEEKEAAVEELLDTGLDPVRIVAAAPEALVVDGRLQAGRRCVVASEYERLTRRWIEDNSLDATFVRSYGATEAFPPEDADCIVDNTATGSTLHANGLAILSVLAESSTRLYAHPAALQDPDRRERIEHFTLLLRSVLEARDRVMVEVNVPAEALEAVLAVMPCMREPTISNLSHDIGYAVKAAVPRADLPELIPVLKRAGGTDIIATALSQIVP